MWHPAFAAPISGQGEQPRPLWTGDPRRALERHPPSPVGDRGAGSRRQRQRRSRKPFHGRARSREGILSGFDILPRWRGARSDEGGPERTEKEKMDESPPRIERGRLFGGSEELLPLTSRGWNAADHVAAR